MALAGWGMGDLQRGSIHANIITAASDATMSLLQLNLHSRR